MRGMLMQITHEILQQHEKMALSAASFAEARRHASTRGGGAALAAALSSVSAAKRLPQEAKETGGWSTEDLKLTCETFRERGLFKAYDFTV